MQRGVNELKLFQAVMTDDSEHLGEVLMRMTSRAPVDVPNIKNHRGQTLLDLAVDRGKDECAQFLTALYKKVNYNKVKMTGTSSKPDELRQKEPTRSKQNAKPSQTQQKKHKSFARCVCDTRAVLLLQTCFFPM